MRKIAVAAVLLFVSASAARADDWSGSSAGPTFQPSVPISALARPASWLDPSRFHITSSISVGSGFGGTQGLQVTTLGYQFKAPVWFNVSVGNSFGAGSPGSPKPFLEGLDVGFRPMSNMLVRVEYHDFRSPLQYGPNYYNSPYGIWGR
jgi:opacity protein-like surface antigen